MATQILEYLSSLNHELAPMLDTITLMKEDKSIGERSPGPFIDTITHLHIELVAINEEVVRLQKFVREKGDPFLSVALSPQKTIKLQSNLKTTREKLSEARVCCGKCRAMFEKDKRIPHFDLYLYKIRLDDKRRGLKPLRMAISKVHIRMLAKSLPIPSSCIHIENTEACITFLEDAFRQKPFEVSKTALTDDLRKAFLGYNSSEANFKLLLQHFETFGQRWAAGQFPAALDGLTRIERARKIHIFLAKYLLAALINVPVDGDPSSLLTSQVEIVSERLKKWLNQNETPKLVIAIGGHFSHGKSSLINAIVGFPVLPAMDTFTTAVPCRIIHDSKAEAPSLKIPDLEPYQTALARLKAHQVDCNHKAGFLDENRERSLKDVVNEALGIFRDERFPIAIASGVQEVVRQLHHYNTLIRICHRLGIPFQVDDPGIWPRVTTRLSLLADQDLDDKVKIELLDLPGFNDSVESGNGNAEAFAHMMYNAANEATSIIPVVEYREAFKVVKHKTHAELNEINAVWRRTLRQKSWMERISLVLVTKAQLAKNPAMRQQVQSKVSSFTWDCPMYEERVVLCDSLLAMAALQLECEIQEDTPSSEILGRIADSRDVLNPIGWCFPTNYLEQEIDWQAILEKAQTTSGVLKLQKALTVHLYNLALHGNLKDFHADLGLWIRTIISFLCRPLSDARLSDTVFDLAQKEAQQEVTMIQRHISRWDVLTSKIRVALEVELDTKYRAFVAEVEKAWDRFASEFQRLYSPTLGDFSINDNLISLAGLLYVQQRPFMDETIDLALKGVEEVQKTIKNDVLSKIKDDTQRKLMEDSMKTYRETKQALIFEINKALKGTVSENRFTTAEFMKALEQWLPRGQIRRRIQRPQHSSGDVLSLTSSMASSSMASSSMADDHPQPPEQNTLCPDGRATNISAIDATTNAARTSGFMYGEEECSPSQMAAAFLQTMERNTREGGSTPSAEWILKSLREDFVDRYLVIMSEQARMTVSEQINRTAQGCLRDLERLAMVRQEDFKKRQQRDRMETENQTLTEMLALGNLVAGIKAMEVLETQLKAITI